MSVVGPRPHMLRHTEDYSKTIHNFMDRHRVMPGITGLAQVTGYRGETIEVEAMVKRVNADIDYVRNWSFWLDVKIVVRTVVQVVKGAKAPFNLLLSFPKEERCLFGSTTLHWLD
ncbi:MAG: sugar transferase [Hymenobacter sp.]